MPVYSGGKDGIVEEMKPYAWIRGNGNITKGLNIHTHADKTVPQYPRFERRNPSVLWSFGTHKKVFYLQARVIHIRLGTKGDTTDKQ